MRPTAKVPSRFTGMRQGGGDRLRGRTHCRGWGPEVRTTRSIVLHTLQLLWAESPHECHHTPGASSVWIPGAVSAQCKAGLHPGMMITHNPITSPTQETKGTGWFSWVAVAVRKVSTFL